MRNRSPNVSLSTRIEPLSLRYQATLLPAVSFVIVFLFSFVTMWRLGSTDDIQKFATFMSRLVHADNYLYEAIFIYQFFSKCNCHTKVRSILICSSTRANKNCQIQIVTLMNCSYRRGLKKVFLFFRN